MLRSRVMARFAYLECHCSLFRTVRSETCPCSVATLLNSQLCTRALAIGSCKSDKRAAKLHLASCTYVRSAITDGHAHLWIQNFFQQRSRRSFPIFCTREQVSYCKLRSCDSFTASTEASVAQTNPKWVFPDPYPHLQQHQHLLCFTLSRYVQLARAAWVWLIAAYTLK